MLSEPPRDTSFPQFANGDGDVSRVAVEAAYYGIARAPKEIL